MKYVDDRTVAASINLKRSLNFNDSDQRRPLTHRDRTEHTYHHNLLKLYLSDTEEFSNENNMTQVQAGA